MRVPTLFLLCCGTTITAQELDLPSTIGALSRECPTQMARLTPCIDTSADLTTCTECVSTFILDADFGGGGGGGTGEVEGRQEENSNATTTTTGGGDDSSSSTCAVLQDTVCRGIDTCGASCGIVDSTSFFTFGSECEQLFLNLVTCVLESQGVGAECDIGSCAPPGGEGEGDNSSSSIGHRLVRSVWMVMIGAMLVV
jgi:hypothetical protein